MREYVSWGAGPRASQYLILAAQGARDPRRPLRASRSRTSRALARPTLQHRLILNFHAEAEGVRAGELVDRLLDRVRHRRSALRMTRATLDPVAARAARHRCRSRRA